MTTLPCSRCKCLKSNHGYWNKGRYKSHPCKIHSYCPSYTWVEAPCVFYEFAAEPKEGIRPRPATTQGMVTRFRTGLMHVLTRRKDI